MYILFKIHTLILIFMECIAISSGPEYSICEICNKQINKILIVGHQY